MNKKIIIPIIVIPIILVGLIGWQNKSYSDVKLPYPSPGLADDPHACIQTVGNEITIMRQAWKQNVQTMLDQELPTSEIVDDAFESLRTYRCWLDYLCETVLYSANADPVDIAADPQRKVELLLLMDNLPGCVDAHEVQVPGTQLRYMPLCQGPQNTSTRMSYSQRMLSECHDLVRWEFGELPEDGAKSSKAAKIFKDQSPAFISLERQLLATSAEKKNRAMQDKIYGLLNKMMAMESHMERLKQQIFRFDDLLPCFIAKCD